MKIFEQVLVIMLIAGISASLFVCFAFFPLHKALKNGTSPTVVAMRKLVQSLMIAQGIGIVTPLFLALVLTDVLYGQGLQVATWIVVTASIAAIVESTIIGHWAYKTYKLLTSYEVN